MIVRAHDQGVLLISQPAHAALAGRIMDHWRPLRREPRSASIRLAIAQHDNGWREPDTTPTLDEAGRVADFVHIAGPVRQAVWPRGVGRLEATDPWAAALVAQHAVTVYARFRTDPDWLGFFSTMETARDRLAARAGFGEAALRHDYAYVRLGDLISLTFCTGWSEEQSYDGWRVRLEDPQRVSITPGELEPAKLPIAVETIPLPAASFPSRRKLHAALRAAPRQRLTGTVVNGARSTAPG